MLEFKSFSKTPRYKNLYVRITQKLDGTNGLIAINKYIDEGANEVIEFKVGSRNQWLPSSEEILQRDEEIKDWKEKFQAAKDKGFIEYKDIPINRIVKTKPEKLHDNHGFSKWAHENKEALIAFLGEGYHFGEWCGKGIQNGEGLKEKGFYLFSPPIRYFKKYLTDQIKTPCDIEIPVPGLHFVPELFNGKLEDDFLNSIDGIIDHYAYNLQEEGSNIGDGSVKPEGLIVEINGKLTFKVILNESEKDKRGE